jgi:pimeloyl-ACP methyl ester carboxylesterase
MSATGGDGLGPQDFTHRMVAVDGALSFHTVEAGSGPPVYLLHGFPQTWFEWRHVMRGLEGRFTAVAVDLKGAGHSTKAVGGYDKVTMARELDRLRVALGHDEIQVVGHDIGAMVAYAWAATSRTAVTRLAVVDAPLPGTTAWGSVMADPRLWHFAFHMKRDLPELLLAGNERAYVEAFLRDRAYDQGAISDADVEVYARAMAQPGATRGMLEWYRAFPQDDTDNRALRDDKLTVPVLAVGGEHRWGPRMVEMMSELATDVVGGAIPDCGHWVPDERPGELTEALLSFLA